MNSILRKITNEMWSADTNNFYRKIGNYGVGRTFYNYEERTIIRHFYFRNKICEVDVDKKEFKLFNCGYKNYRLTTAQLNYLEQFYKNKGFKLIYKGE